ncbi:hypothetical protein U3A98_001488 [Cronobacter turicensis]|nr:hypothetical protein [Cronobacter turicensis]EMA4137821.1 hypothetical protein [Cronobacter turicensis]
MNSDSIALWNLIIAALTLLLTGFVSWRQIKEKIELSYPRQKAHQKMCYIKPFSQEIEELHEILFTNIDRKIYLSIGISEEDAKLYEDEDEGVCSISIPYTKLQDFEEGEKPSSINSLRLSINVKKNKNSLSKCYCYYGFIEVRGYFTIVNTGGPRMGEVWVTIAAS